MAKDNFAELDELNNRSGSVDVEEEGGGEIDFVTLLVVTRKSLIWIVLLIMLGLSASYLFIRYTKPVFRSSSVIKLDEQSQAGALGLGGSFGEAADQQKNMISLSGEVELIKSNLIYSRLKEALNLKVNYYAMGNVLNEELYNNSPFQVAFEVRDNSFYNKKINVDFLGDNRFRLSYLMDEGEVAGEYSFGEKINKKEISLVLTPAPGFTEDVLDQKYHFIINSDGALNSYFNQNLAVEIINPSANTIGISFTDHNPVKAHDIVNKIDSIYLEQKKLRKSEATRLQLGFLDEQLKETKDNLMRSEYDIQDFAQKNKTYDIKGDISKSMGKMEELQKERYDLNNQISLLNDILNLVSRNSSLDQVVPSLKTVDDGDLSQKISELSDLQINYTLLKRSYTGETEAVRRYEKEMDYSRQAVIKSLQQNMKLLQKQANALTANIGALEGQLNQLPEKETQRVQLQRLYDLYEKYYLTLSDKKVEFNIAKAGTVADFQILSPATLPGAPIYPDKLIVYAIGLASGLILGIGLIAVRYFMHNTVTNIGEVERNTKAAVLGVVPRYTKERLPVSKLIVDKNPKSAISESIRSIRTNLEFISSSKKKRLITITSTVSGEGKTFVAVNLGGIIALSDQKVIILDLDLRKPKVNIAFDAENNIGVSTILIEKHTVQECIQKTSVENLHFIPAGPTPPNPSELILNSKFGEMLEELHKIYDVIIVDTPPIGLVTDGILVMRKADIPIYIVRADYSKKVFLKNINKVMRTNNFNNLTVVLNDARGAGAYGYGYGYGYEYGYGNSYYDEEEREGLLTRLRRNFT
jgi:capsular exopolysaccharide synthesis family protein